MIKHFFSFFLLLLPPVFYAATYTVNATNDLNDGTCDGGHCSLREAINAANVNPGADIIDFSTSGIITLTLALPSITEAVTIDGYAGAPGGAAVNTNATGALNGTLTIVLDGATNSVATGLNIAIGGGGSVIKGLVFSGFGDGTPSNNDVVITISSGSNQILGCYIGTNAAGSAATGRSTYGILISGAASNTIGDGTAAGRNLISGIANTATSTGIRISGISSQSNVIKGNIIGLAADGATRLDGNSYGIHLVTNARNNTIGGIGAGDGNVISGNNNRGIFLQSAHVDGNTVIGNIIGTQADGDTRVTSSTQLTGIYIGGGAVSSLNNTVGGNTANHKNVISGNQTQGIYIDNESTGNHIKGNYIGIAADGAGDVALATQDYGIYITGTAHSNTIGGSAAGEGNVVSGADNGLGTASGLSVNSTHVSGNTIMGNIIGPQADGATWLKDNQATGIEIFNSPNNIIGGNDANKRNILSSNGVVGIEIKGAASTGTVVKGNYIGIATNGTSTILFSSQNTGIYIHTNAASNTIGGTAAGEKNVISGNNPNSGILINGGGLNTIIGNIIGPQADGNTWLNNNQVYGIFLQNGTQNNIIGGNTINHRNIISANGTYGIMIDGSTTTGNTVKGNYIGLAGNGTSAIASSSQDYGVYITSSAVLNTIGGSGADEGNVISGNSNGAGAGVGVQLQQALPGNEIIGNVIGLQADGETWLDNNQGTGVNIFRAYGQIIGGNTPGHRNIISGNATYGVYITHGTSRDNIIKGNYIGLAGDGISAVASATQDYGVYITGSSYSNIIGGSAAGEGNVISGQNDGASTGIGVYCNSSYVTGNTFIGNIIGPTAGGDTWITETQNVGLRIDGSYNNIIGGNTAGHRNVISANGNSGLEIIGSSTGNTVTGNYIGIAADGNTFIEFSSQTSGIALTQSTLNTIGGVNEADRNIVSGNSQSGIIFSTLANSNTIIGNTIGPQKDGDTYVVDNSQLFGVFLTGNFGACNNNIIGQSTGVRQIIAGNESMGIAISNGSCSGNVIQSNYIGIASDGLSALSGADSQDYGIYLGIAHDNEIGGDAGVDDENPEGNIIANHTVAGIFITGAASTGNLVSKNLIYSNTGKAINLAGTGNSNYASPTVDRTFTATVITGTAQNGDIIQVFKNASGDCQDAPVFLGSTTANGSGDWTFNSTVSLAAGETPTATARHSTNNNTSEFACPDWVGLPISLLSFSAVAIDKSYTQLNWQTATEINNDYFTVEASPNPSKGESWSVVGIVQGAGNSSTVKSYSLMDYSPPFEKGNGWAYYRLKQTDFDGSFSYSNIVSVNITNSSLTSFNVYPNPGSGNDIFIFIAGNINDNVHITIRDILGKELYHNNLVLAARENTIKLSGDFVLVQGMYTVSVATNNEILSKKLIVK